MLYLPRKASREIENAGGSGLLAALRDVQLMELLLAVQDIGFVACVLHGGDK